MEKGNTHIPYKNASEIYSWQLHALFKIYMILIVTHMSLNALCVCVRACVHACVCACVPFFPSASMWACMCVCVPAYVSMCVRACVHACVRECVRVLEVMRQMLNEVL